MLNVLIIERYKTKFLSISIAAFENIFWIDRRSEHGSCNVALKFQTFPFDAMLHLYYYYITESFLWYFWNVKTYFLVYQCLTFF